MNRIPTDAYGTPAALSRQDEPPADRKALWIERLKGAQVKSFHVLSSTIWGVWTHYDGARTVGCLRQKSVCQGCVNQLPRRWKGYLHAYDCRRRHYVFVELTPTAARSLLEQVGKQTSLRGVRLDLKRTQSDKGRLVPTIAGWVDNPQNLPHPADPEETLRKMWGQCTDVTHGGGLATGPADGELVPCANGVPIDTRDCL